MVIMSNVSPVSGSIPGGASQQYLTALLLSAHQYQGQRLLPPSPATFVLTCRINWASYTTKKRNDIVSSSVKVQALQNVFQHENGNKMGHFRVQLGFCLPWKVQSNTCGEKRIVYVKSPHRPLDLQVFTFSTFRRT